MCEQWLLASGLRADGKLVSELVKAETLTTVEGCWLLVEGLRVCEGGAPIGGA